MCLKIVYRERRKLDSVLGPGLHESAGQVHYTTVLQAPATSCPFPSPRSSCGGRTHSDRSGRCRVNVWPDFPGERACWVPREPAAGAAAQQVRERVAQETVLLSVGTCLQTSVLGLAGAPGSGNRAGELRPTGQCLVQCLRQPLKEEAHGHAKNNQLVD